MPGAKKVNGTPQSGGRKADLMVASSLLNLFVEDHPLELNGELSDFRCIFARLDTLQQTQKCAIRTVRCGGPCRSAFFATFAAKVDRRSIFLFHSSSSHVFMIRER